MIQRAIATVCFAVGFSCASAAGGNNQEMPEIVANFFSLVEQGQTAQVIALGDQAVKAAERELGPTHPGIALILSSLAVTQANEGSVTEAEVNTRRALAIIESLNDPDHRIAAAVHSLAGGVRFKQGKYAEAELHFRRSIAIQERDFGPDDPSLLSNLNYLAQTCKAQRNYKEAETLYGRYLTMQEKYRGPNHLETATILNSLAELYEDQGKYGDAEPIYLRSMAIREQHLPPGHPQLLSSNQALAILYKKQGKFSDAEKFFQRALDSSEVYSAPDKTMISALMFGLADLYRAQGLYSKAEQFYRGSIVKYEETRFTSNFGVDALYLGLADLYHSQGRYNEAEPLYWQAIATIEKEFGRENSFLGVALDRIGVMLIEQGRFSEAEPIIQRSLTINENSLGPDNDRLAMTRNNLAVVYMNLGNEAKAQTLLVQSFTTLEKTLGPDHPDLIQPLNNRAHFLISSGKHQEAEVLYKRALSITEKTFGTDHIYVALSLNNLADLYGAVQGKSLEAEALWQRAIDIYDKLDHPNIVTPLGNLAGNLEMRGEHSRALDLTRRSTEVHKTRIVGAPSANSALQEAKRNRAHFELHINLLALALNRVDAPATLISDESFQVAQLMRATGTEDSVAKMSARFAKGDGDLAKLIRDRQDAEARRAQAEAAFTGAFGKIAQERNPALEQRLRDEIAAAGKAIQAADAELARRFPDYQELARLQPVSVDEVRALLKPGEAMLVYALVGDVVYLWVVTKDSAQFGWLKAKVLDTQSSLAKVRGQMEFDVAGNAPRVSVDVLHALYQALIAPALPHLSGISHLLIVPDGALQSLPFGMLVASPPPAINTDADYRKVDWLARHYATSVLPAVGSIKALRQFARGGEAKEPFAGFGDPLVGEADGASRGKRAKVDIATVFRGTRVRGASGQPLPTLEIADVEAIRKTPRLPETADELRQIGKALKAGPDSIRLQQQATETAVKTADLSKYQTLAFATHAMTAGEVAGVGEPGLILTPPKNGTLADDGYLAASEVAGLRLNADWTILSACNTAAADGTPGAEGLSGLAKAFFYAGSRSLLVSHWPVASDATVPLTTAMLAEYKANPAQGKAEAHRKSMLVLMDSADHPEFAHPIYWAPFVVVGEGGTK